MSMSKLEKFAFTYGAGLVTGAVLALLYTPVTGKKLQRKFADATDKVVDTVDGWRTSPYLPASFRHAVSRGPALSGIVFFLNDRSSLKHCPLDPKPAFVVLK